MKRWIAVLILMSASASTLAGNLYRYENDQGIMVINDTVPPEFVHKGYDVLNSSGRVIERVSGEPFEAYVDKQILRPLGMRDSFFDRAIKARARAANLAASRSTRRERSRWRGGEGTARPTAFTSTRRTR